MTLIFKYDVGSFKLNQQAKCICQDLARQKSMTTQIQLQIYLTIQLLGGQLVYVFIHLKILGGQLVYVFIHLISL